MDLPFYDIFASPKVPLLKISDDINACIVVWATPSQKSWRHLWLQMVSYQARRQDSVTGRTEINIGSAREVYLCEFERGMGAREIYPTLDQMDKVKTKDSDEIRNSNVFPAQNR